MQIRRLNPDFSSTEFQEQLYVHYQHYLENSPVFQSDEGVVYITRYDDCTALLSGKQFKRRHPDGDSPFNSNQGSMTAIEKMIDQWMLFMDPPRHDVVRKAFMAPFSAKSINLIEPFIRLRARQLIEKLPDEGCVELLHGFAHPLPVMTIAEIIGVPSSDMDLFNRWSSQLTQALDTANESGFKQGTEATLALSAYFAELLQYGAQLPEHCLIRSMENNTKLQLSADELLYGLILLLWAGHETTKNLIANGIQLLAEHPQALVELKQQPGLLPQAIEEMLRYDTPVQKISRWTHEPTIFSNCDIQSGTLITALLGAANRDPSVFENPNNFDIHRSKNRHLSFGTGIHHCLGAFLSRLEARIAFEELLPKINQLRPAEHRWRTYSAFRSMDLLTVEIS